LYHRFWAENALVMGWEISMVNDDKRDNRFLEDSGRFPMIQ
ncbi:D-lyxose/D-mannose family sugar isomerase, partial [Klebsiella michiganensis]